MRPRPQTRNAHTHRQSSECTHDPPLPGLHQDTITNEPHILAVLSYRVLYQLPTTYPLHNTRVPRPHTDSTPKPRAQHFYDPFGFGSLAEVGEGTWVKGRGRRDYRVRSAAALEYLRNPTSKRHTDRNMPVRDMRAAGNTAFLGALFFVVSAMLRLDAYAVQHNARSNIVGGYEAYTNLTVPVLQQIWAARHAAQTPTLFSELFGALAWFCIMSPVASLMDLLGGEARSGTRLVSNAFNAAAVMSMIDLVFQAGAKSAADWAMSWPPMSDTHHLQDGGFGPLQAMEIVWVMIEARQVWWIAMDELLLAVGWGTAAFLICTQRGYDQPVPKGLGCLAIFGAVTACVGFGFEIARIFNWVLMMYFALVTAVFVYLLFLPAWLVWLGVILRAKTEFVAYASTATGGVSNGRVKIGDMGGSRGEVEMPPPIGSTADAGSSSFTEVGQEHGTVPQARGLQPSSYGGFDSNGVESRA